MLSARKNFTLFPRHSRKASRILHVTDSEGSHSFFNTIKNNNIVYDDPDRGLCFHNTSGDEPYFIFGGDAVGRGNHDLAIIKKLIAFKERHPNNVFLLAGNRDISMNRLFIELSSQLIYKRLLESSAPHWIHKKTLPLEYVEKVMAAEYYKGNPSANNAADFIKSLETEKCQLLYLKWMLEKTMGCPHTFRYRREELERMLNTMITDGDVLRSFIQESSPEGLAGKYLQLAQVGVIIPNTGVLAVHGGLTAENIGHVPQDAMPHSNAHEWINNFNQWFETQIDKWMQYRPGSKLTPPAYTDLDACVLPLHGKIKSVITADMLDDEGKFAMIPETVDYFAQTNDIRLVLTGHQPCGKHPAIVRGSSTLFINGDTGYAAFNPAKPDDTRGHAQHVMEIQACRDSARVNIKAVLPDQSCVETDLTVTRDGVKGDPYIGKLTADNKLVQYRLPNGDYSLAYKKGIKMEYTSASADEVEKMLVKESEMRMACNLS